MTAPIVIPRRFRGPEASANGGYTCGTLAELVDADVVEVTLRKPPPLDIEMTLQRDGESVRALHNGVLVAEARPAALDLEAPQAADFAEAKRLSDARGDDPDHPFPGCFVCGPKADGLRLRPAPLGDGRLAAPWVVATEFASERFAWAALDCPGGWAVQPDGSRGLSVLGRLTARVDSAPRAGDECVVIGWPLGDVDGRKRDAGTALFRDGALLALGRATWFTVDDAFRDATR
ncbi:MAG: hypothetical protein QOG85_1601 [Gaiellaceae bacterium]|jgi:hypothetical protein|nr:hypothetical protein [Gaiellaceae bacterium]